MIDLDDVKGINDGDGHQAGDAVPAETARRLQLIGRAGDTVARWGGDEFLFVLPGCSRSAAQRLRARVGRSIAQPIRLGALSVAVSASVGVAVGRRGDDLNELVLQADGALQAVKASRSAASTRPGLQALAGA